ncbi:chemotaxis protein CheW [Pueribacillus theae]|uniref:Chemotaxis protein CheW n=1 Tax=Pueribacillus theae TaxID=2171751 RepID=A0A2U1K854_9BACI|nr:chemotaxis protein CheW [Pueribacillus theae]PWA13525.1 chemotaxis protein CheW [Pueribacillus theae]
MEQNAKAIKAVIFQLKNEEYGVDVQQVQSIERMIHITRVPKMPAFVKGVINLRGIVTPIIDLKERFSIDTEDYTESTRIIIVAVEDKEVGLIVDAANDVIDIPADAVEPPPEVVGHIEADYLQGIAKLGDRLLILLNLDKVLSAEELLEIEQIEA